MTKSRFFREKSVEKFYDSGDDIDYLPGQVNYKSPYRKSDIVGMDVPAEEFPDFDPNVSVTYKKSSTQFFTCSRKDLPQFFVDHRVQVRMTNSMGKGCFATDRIEKNTVVESAPVILLHRDTFVNLNTYNDGTHKLSEYPFSWGRDGQVAFALGYGGIYNHKVDPNLSWRPNYETESIQYTAVRDIEVGEELFIRYVPLYRMADLWFSDEESEEVARRYEKEMKEDPGTIKTWKMFKPGDKLPRLE